MQIAVILVGCILGFVGGVVAFAGLGFGLFASLSIWAASGPLTVLFLVGLSALRQPQAQATSPARAEVA